VIAPRKLLAGDAIAAIRAVGRPSCHVGTALVFYSCCMHATPIQPTYEQLQLFPWLSDFVV
jgi:hypothetical protein